ncbi:putative membrane protein [Thioflavicoccus mobilis 8321]|uniref:Putative membrane protein n=1 Tax=Thioflavicoccus mobilis 8321 TaxID=765912 RepID=L0GZA6_9GAMM|nr:PH domain-containing protein [Thioflavicoccus mobilis]AGA91296.1 putative membrane protein [Thioflavicoccus mobilis 8321]
MDKYTESTLLSEEQIVYSAKLHWFIFVVPVSLIIVGTSDKALTILIFVGAIWAALRMISYLTTEFAVTNEKVVIKAGFIKRKIIEVVNTQIEGVRVSQGYIGRLLDFGTVSIGGTGGIAQSFSNIANPLKLREQVLDQVKKAQNP